jgi:hypothetical protein
MHAEGRPAQRRVGRVQRARVSIELVARGRQLGVCEGRIDRRRCGGERGPQRIEHRAFAGLVAVKLKAELAQAAGRQARVHHLERGHLLADEQHAPATGQRLSDHVGDRLALAGAGRPLQHEAGAGTGGGNRPGLARVGVEHLVAVLGRARV